MSMRHRHSKSATTSITENDALFAPNRILTNAEQELVLEKLSRDYRTSTVFIRVLGILHFILACLYIVLAVLGITFTSSANRTHYHHNTKTDHTNFNAATLHKKGINYYIALPSWESFMSYMSRMVLLLSSIVLGSCGTSILCATRSLRFCREHDQRNKVKKNRSSNNKISSSSR